MHGSGKDRENVTHPTLCSTQISLNTDTYPPRLNQTVTNAVQNVPHRPVQQTLGSGRLYMRSVVRSPIIWAVALLLAGPAAAADTTTFNVTLVVTKACTITAAAATNVDFGTAASTTATPTVGQGTVTAQCSALTPYTISLNAGANAGTANDVTTRRMKNTNAAVTANNFVGYQLYQDAAHTLVWGATSGTNTQAGIGTGLAVPYQVYGQITNLSTNNAAAGNYLDTVTATITY